MTSAGNAAVTSAEAAAAFATANAWTDKVQKKQRLQLEARAMGHAPDLEPGAQLLWRGDEAVADALELVAAAEAAVARAAADTGAGKGGEPQEFVWRQPLMRPAGNAQQVRMGATLFLQLLIQRIEFCGPNPASSHQ